jgi:hypothetical protein
MGICSINQSVLSKKQSRNDRKSDTMNAKNVISDFTTLHSLRFFLRSLREISDFQINLKLCCCNSDTKITKLLYCTISKFSGSISGSPLNLSRICATAKVSFSQ